MLMGSTRKDGDFLYNGYVSLPECKTFTSPKTNGWIAKNDGLENMGLHIKNRAIFGTNSGKKSGV